MYVRIDCKFRQTLHATIVKFYYVFQFRSIITINKMNQYCGKLQASPIAPINDTVDGDIQGNSSVVATDVGAVVCGKFFERWCFEMRSRTRLGRPQGAVRIGYIRNIADSVARILLALGITLAPVR